GPCFVLASSLVIPRPPRSPLLPYTTLFRSRIAVGQPEVERHDRRLDAEHGQQQQGERGAQTVRQFRDPRAELRQGDRAGGRVHRSEEHTSELQSREKLVCRLLLEKKNIFTS